jgi:hypothetical protein
MIYAMLKGELPPRALMGVDERSSVHDVRRAVYTAFREPSDRECRLCHGEVALSDDDATLASYGVAREALIHAELC